MMRGKVVLEVAGKVDRDGNMCTRECLVDLAAKLNVVAPVSVKSVEMTWECAFSYEVEGFRIYNLENFRIEHNSLVVDIVEEEKREG